MSKPPHNPRQRGFVFNDPLPTTGKSGARYVLNTSRAHTQGPKAKGKITLPKLKFMEKEI